MASDPLAILRALTEAHRRALAPLDAAPVPALKHTQCGQPCLVAECPRCRTVAAIAGHDLGRHLCRGCGLLLGYEPND